MFRLKPIITIIICLLLTCSCTSEREKESEELRQLQKEARALIHKKEYIDAIRLLNQAKTIATKEENKTSIFEVDMALAQCYFGMYNYEESSAILTEAYLFSKNNLPRRYQNYALGNLALLNFKKGDTNSSEASFNEIVRFARKDKDSLLLSSALGNLALVEMQKRNYGNAKNYIDSSLYYLPVSKNKLRVELMSNKVEIMNAAGEYDKALALLREIDERLVETPDSLAAEMAIVEKAKSYNGIENYDEARKYAARAMTLSDIPTRIDMLILLKDIEANSGNVEKSLDYANKALAAKDSFAAETMKWAFRSSKVRLELADAKSKLNYGRIIIAMSTIIIVALIVIIGVVYLYYRNRIKLHRMRRVNAERQQTLMEQELHDNESHLEELQEEVDITNRTIASKAANLSMLKDRIENYISTLDSIQSLKSDPEYKKATSAFMLEIKNSYSFEESLVYFEKVNSGFLNRLKSLHPNLTATDIRFICYIYMQLTTKEISTLVNISQESCKKRKQRLSAKLGLENASKLYAYISSI